MKEDKREYLGILCKLYMIALLAVLPLYLPDGYYMLGDMKYRMFRSCTLICFGIWFLMEVYVLLCGAWYRIRGLVVAEKGTGNRRKLCTVDIFMLAYGGCVLLSAICSPYEAAWSGYRDWYMGAVSQLLFVGIYFFASRYYSYDRLTIYVAEAALAVVVVVGILNRLGLDPFGCLRGFTETAWEYSHMISTLGNINWFCGYCSVLLAFPISGYLYTKRKAKTIILYLVSVLGLTILFLQGSDSGMVLAAVAIGCCLLAGVKKPEFFLRGLLLFTGMSVGIWLMGQLITLRDAWAATPVDGWIYGKMTWGGWLVFAAVTLGFYFLCRKLSEQSGERRVRRLLVGSLAVLLLTIVTIGVFVILKWSQGASGAWGSGRGILWRLAWEGFLQADWSGKFIGAGPDCFAEYLTEIGKPPIITDEDYWANAIFANAHNEWLNHLVNLGILGVGCYAGIFVAAFKRYRGMMLAVLVLAMYGVHSLVSFQQVLNTPMLFAVLGLCEATYRRKMAVNDLTRE